MKERKAAHLYANLPKITFLPLAKNASKTTVAEQPRAFKFFGYCEASIQFLRTRAMQRTNAIKQRAHPVCGMLNLLRRDSLDEWSRLSGDLR